MPASRACALLCYSPWLVRDDGFELAKPELCEAERREGSSSLEALAYMGRNRQWLASVPSLEPLQHPSIAFAVHVHPPG